MANYFEILGVDVNSSEKEIKLAYVKKIREFPPEKEPEKYDEIRKAYETLIDENERVQYIAYINYGEEIEELDKVVSESLDNGDYEKAISALKKILLIEPKLKLMQNRLALAYIYNKQFDEGIKVLEALIKQCPKEAVYVGNLSFGYKEKGEIEKAEELCLKALDMAPYNENNLEMLMDIYIEKKEVDKGLEYIKNKIEECKTEDFREFIYYYEGLRINTFKENSEGTRQWMKNLSAIIPEDKEIRDFVLWKISTLADRLYERSVFTDSSIILEEVLKFHKNDYYEDLYEETKKLSAIVKILNTFLEDKRIPKELTTPIYYYFVRFRMLNSEYEESMEKATEELKDYIKANSKAFQKEFKIFKEEYSELYNLKKWYFKRIERMI